MNKNRIYLIQFLTGLGLALPIWQVFYTTFYKVSLNTATSFWTTAWLSTALATVFTGAIADRWGRARAYQVGIAISGAMHIIAVATKFTPLVYASLIVMGVFYSLTTGVLEPILDKLDHKGSPNAISNMRTITYISRLVGGVSGAVLFKYWMTGPYVVTAISYFLAAILINNFVGIDQKFLKHKNSGVHIGAGFKILWQKKPIVKILLIMFGVALVDEAAWIALQSIFKFKSIDVGLFGVLFGIVAGVSAIGAYAARHLSLGDQLSKTYNRQRNVNILMTILFVLSMLLLKVDNTVTLIISLVMLGFVFGFLNPLASLIIVKYVDKNYASTILSIKDFLYTFVFVVTSTITAYSISKYGVINTINFIILQALSLISILVFIKIITIFKSKEKYHKNNL